MMTLKYNVLQLQRLELPVLLFLGLVVRMLFVTGIELSDDLEYTRIAHTISAGTYYPEPHSFSLRYGLLLPLALVFRLAGVSEWTAVVPSLLASLGGIALARAIGRRLFDAHVGRCAALLLVCFPLDVALATTISTDPLVAFWIGAAFWLILKADEQGHTVWYFLAGAALGLAYLSKETGIIFCPALFAWQFWERKRPSLLFAVGIGLSAVILLETLYYILTVHDPFFRLHFIGGTYVSFMMVHYLDDQPLWQLLVGYPYQLLLPFSTFRHYYGPFYLIALLLLILNRRVVRNHATHLPLIWIGVSLLLLNYTPMQIWPFKPIIVAIPRYIAPLSIPLMILLALLIRETPLFGTKNRVSIAVGLLGFSAFVSLAMLTANHVVGPDIGYPLRETAQFLKKSSSDTVYSDKRSVSALQFLLEYRRNETIRTLPANADSLTKGYLFVNPRQLKILSRWEDAKFPDYVFHPKPVWRMERLIQPPGSMSEQLRIRLADLVLGQHLSPIPRETTTLYALSP